MHKGSPVLQPHLPFALQISNLGREFQEVWPLASLLHTGQMSECCLAPAAAAILHRCPGGTGCLRLPPVMPALYLALHEHVPLPVPCIPGEPRPCTHGAVQS